MSPAEIGTFRDAGERGPREIITRKIAGLAEQQHRLNVVLLLNLPSPAEERVQGTKSRVTDMLHVDRLRRFTANSIFHPVCGPLGLLGGIAVLGLSMWEGLPSGYVQDQAANVAGLAAISGGILAIGTARISFDSACLNVVNFLTVTRLGRGSVRAARVDSGVVISVAEGVDVRPSIALRSLAQLASGYSYASDLAGRIESWRSALGDSPSDVRRRPRLELLAYIAIPEILSFLVYGISRS